MAQVVLLSSSSAVSALIRMAFDNDGRYVLAGEVADIDRACELVNRVGALALIFDEAAVAACPDIAEQLQTRLPGVALLEFAPGRANRERRFVPNASELEGAETALSIGNALAMMLQTTEPAV